MYQLFRAEIYKLRRDRTFHIVLLIFVFLVMRSDVPALVLHNFTYTGDNWLLFRTTQDTWVNHYKTSFGEAFRNQISAMRLAIFGMFYCLVMLRREIVWRGYETKCAIRRERAKIILADMLTSFGITILFPVIEALIFIVVWCVREGGIGQVELMSSIPCIVSLLLFYLLLVVILYSIAFLSHHAMAAIVFYIMMMSVNLVLDVRLLSAEVKGVLKYFDIVTYQESLATMTEWSSAMPYILGFSVMILVFGGLTLWVSQTKDVEIGGVRT